MLWSGNRVTPIFQRLRAPAGSDQSVFGGAEFVYEAPDRGYAADDFRRWRAVARLHIRGRCRRTLLESVAGKGASGKYVQRREWRPFHAEPDLGSAAENGKGRSPREIR